MAPPRMDEKRPMNARTFRALLHSLSDAERITFGKIVIEKLIEQPDGIYNMVRICVMNLSEEEHHAVNQQLRRVREQFQQKGITNGE